MFLADVAIAAGKKITKDLKTLGDNTESTATAIIKGDKEKLEELSGQFAKNAAIGCLAVAMKKAGFGIVSAIYNGDDVAETLGETLGVVNPVVGSVIVANLLMAGITKVAADEKLQSDIKNSVNKAAISAINKIMS